MKYEAKIDLRNANTSHALLVELVGTERRVLDVGCAAGDLGRVLKQRGCRVAGVELDPLAAEAADRVLDELLVGDVNELDLVAHFGKESFEVVVFGDVLEHLADPVSVLRKVRPLLTKTGSIVASIPNVAHGSIRLALLAGRFDYRELGLLDATHLRFFTRGSVHAVFREAGLVPVDMRRTTAGVFDTEIGIRRADFDQGVVDAVEGDPDSTTYQFVLRAVPEDTPDAIDTDAPQARAPGPEARARIGIWTDGSPDDLRAALVARVTRAEVARRLPGASVRLFSSSPDLRPSPHDGGVPIEPLGPWSRERAARLAAQLDCVLVTGELRAPAGGGGDDPARFLLEGLTPEAEASPEAAEDCPVLWSAVRLPTAPVDNVTLPVYGALLDDGADRRAAMALGVELSTVPDPLLLVPRLLRAEALARRREFLRVMGWFPRQGRAAVVELHRDLLPHADALAAALDTLLRGAGTSVVLVGMEPDEETAQLAGALDAAMTGPCYRLPDGAPVDDVVAAVANADAVAACSPSVLALGLAYERPLAFVDAGGPEPALARALHAASPASAVISMADLVQLLDEARFPAPGGVAGPLQSALDAHFDRAAAIVDAAAAARARTPDDRPVLPPSEHVAAMELAHAQMQQRLDGERRALADHLDQLHRRRAEDLGRAGTEHGALRAERDRVASDLRAARDEAARLRQEVAGVQRRLDQVTSELEALRNIRVLRALRPARAIYARLRGRQL
ncbi:MAG: methyltransferase domain-containing protein [Acidimicrobiales bacterium]